MADNKRRSLENVVDETLFVPRILSEFKKGAIVHDQTRKLIRNQVSDDGYELVRQSLARVRPELSAVSKMDDRTLRVSHSPRTTEPTGSFYPLSDAANLKLNRVYGR